MKDTLAEGLGGLTAVSIAAFVLTVGLAGGRRWCAARVRSTPWVITRMLDVTMSVWVTSLCGVMVMGVVVWAITVWQKLWG